MAAGCTDGDADAELRCALLHAQGEQPEDADGAEQQCDGGEGGREDGDETFTAEGLIDLIAERQEGPDAGVRCVTGSVAR